MISFNIINNKYTVNYNALIAKKIYTSLTQYIHRPLNGPGSRVTNLGISRDTFNLTHDIIPASAFVSVINSETIKDNTLIDIILLATENTIVITNIDSSYTSDYIYATILDTNNKIINTTEFTLNNKEVTNTFVISNNLLNTNLLSSDANDFFSINSLRLQVAGPIDSIGISTLGPQFLFAVETEFTVQRMNNFGQEFINAELDPIWGLSDSTIQISGGSGYSVGDIFDVFGSDNEDDGGAIIEVTEVDESGSILKHKILFDGSFISSPNTNTIFYEGLGFGCNITIDNLFVLKEITVVNPGEHYFSSDEICVLAEDDSVYRIWGLVPNIIIDNSLISAKITDNFTLSDIEVIDPGYNHKLAPEIQIIDRASNSIVPNNVISTNSLNFIDITNT
jgi:hypothetical protein